MNTNGYYNTQGDVTVLKFVSKNQLCDGISKIGGDFDGIASERVVNKSDKVVVLTEDAERVPFEASTHGNELRLKIFTEELEGNPDKVLISKKKE